MGLFAVLTVLLFANPVIGPFYRDAEEDTTKGQITYKNLSLRPEWTLEFNFKEGKWISVDISPDGKSMVFISDRSGSDNVWTMDLESEETKQITKGNN